MESEQAQHETEYDRVYRAWNEGDWAEADPMRGVGLARTLAQIEPSSPDAWEALATTLMIALFPLDGFANVGDGEAASMLDDPRLKEMLGAFERLATLDSADTSAYWNSAIVLRRVGDFEASYRNYMLAAQRDAARPPTDYPDKAAMDYALAAEVILKDGDEKRCRDALRLARAHLDDTESDGMIESLVAEVEHGLTRQA